MKFGRDKFEVIQLCVVVVLAGIFLLLAALGHMRWWHSFNYLVLGAGVLVIIGELIRQAMPCLCIADQNQKRLYLHCLSA